MPLDESAISKALVSVPGQEDYVRQKFWSKARRLAGKVPFLDQVIACFFAAVDPQTPLHVKGTLFAALAYFVLPADMIPDLIAGLGFTDDLAVITVAARAVAPYITDIHVQRAKNLLADDGSKADASFV